MLRFILALRPLLLLAFIAGLIFFTPTPDQERSTRGGIQGQSSLSGTSGDGTRTVDGNENADAARQLAAPSLLAQLFGPDAVDPFFTLPELTTASSKDSPDAPDTPGVEPVDEPARSIYHYFVASSDIGFSPNTSRLGLALATAESGEPEALERLIVELEVRLTEFSALAPPEELTAIHEATARLLLRYVQHLRAAKNREEGSVELTWNNPERTAIAEEATRITQEIRDIVHSHGISLPSGVLP